MNVNNSSNYGTTYAPSEEVTYIKEETNTALSPEILERRKKYVQKMLNEIIPYFKDALEAYEQNPIGVFSDESAMAMVATFHVVFNTLREKNINLEDILGKKPMVEIISKDKILFKLLKNFEVMLDNQRDNIGRQNNTLITTMSLKIKIIIRIHSLF